MSTTIRHFVKIIILALSGNNIIVDIVKLHGVYRTLGIIEDILILFIESIQLPNVIFS